MRIFSRNLELKTCLYGYSFSRNLLQIEKERNSFCAKLDVETKFLSINDTYSLKNVFKHIATTNSPSIWRRVRNKQWWAKSCTNVMKLFH